MLKTSQSVGAGCLERVRIKVSALAGGSTDAVDRWTERLGKN